jgi:uncharacterized membrane protein YphA (DoxX/SURF4 family)
MATSSVAVPERRAKVRNLLVWVLSVLCAALFLFAGVPKLLGVQQMVDQFNVVGLGQWFRYFTGVVEVLGAIGLLIPRTGRLAALLLSLVMVGAFIAIVTRLHQGWYVPIIVLFVLLLIARIRKNQMEA